MTNPEHCYQYESWGKAHEEASYFFLSEGDRLLVKVVKYSYVGVFRQRVTYNLGFGTLNLNNRELEDQDISGNGDPYKVFNTVLNTIPDFLQHYPEAMVMVAGVDSQSGFADLCRRSCKRNCPPPSCRSLHRRIRLYKSYLDKNYAYLSSQYLFFGGINMLQSKHRIEDYRIDSEYDAILFRKR